MADTTPPRGRSEAPAVPSSPAGEAPQTVSFVPPSDATGPCEPALAARTEVGRAPITVPGYEVVEELGRGGMGVVYKALQLRPRRPVALKMILVGGHAGPQHLARFLAEADAVAQLQHPNIVQLYEAGQHQGLPFFSLELCAGGSLHARLAGTPQPPAAAARLVEQVARGVNYAHGHGVVHRDLKPHNVLLAEDGTPKVTDFGLAKRLEEGSGLTASGAVMGTPSYMAPEQAGGRSKEVGPAADVYGLGAILYEMLTGRPPFQAPTPLETMRQVLADEPVPVRRLQPSCPLDLETICLKCLHKEPHRRYSSAADLAEDLRRFQAGEPVVARPVGRAQRAAKWVRRNPVLAGAIAAVAIALLAGTGVSLYFALDASHEADRARASAAEALTARDELELTAACSLLRPLGLQGGEKPASEPEWEALWELAANRRGRLGYRFVEEAARRPGTSRQLAERAALALPAAVGLDLAVRDDVERLLLSRMEDGSLDDEQQTDLARAAAAWDGLSKVAAERTARRLIAAMSANRGPTRLRRLAESVAAVSARLGTAEATQVAARAADVLTGALKDDKEQEGYKQLAEGIAAVAAGLGPEDAARVAAVLIQTGKGAKNNKTGRTQWSALVAVTARMRPRDGAALLAAAVEGVSDTFTLMTLTPGLVAQASRLGPEEAVPVAFTLVEAMRDTKGPERLNELMHSLAAVAERLRPTEAAQIGPRVASILSRAVENAPTDVMLNQLDELEAALAPAGGVGAAAIFTRAVKNARDHQVLASLAVHLSRQAHRLGPEEASKAATALSGAMKDVRDGRALRKLGESLSRLADQMAPAEATRLTTDAAADLVRLLETPGGVPEAGQIVVGLAALARRMAPENATRARSRAAAVLTRTMKATTDSRALEDLAGGWYGLAPGLRPEEAAWALPEAAEILTTAVKGARDDEALAALAFGLSAVALRMPPREGLAVLGRAAQDCRTADAFLRLATSLEALASPNRAGPAEAARAFAGLGAVAIRGLKAERDPMAARLWAYGLVIVADWLPPREAALALAGAMKDGQDEVALESFGNGLTEIASRRGRREVAEAAPEAAAIVLKAMRETKELPAMKHLAHGLAAVGTALPPEEVAAAAALIASCTARTPEDATTLATALAMLLTDAPPAPEQQTRLASVIAAVAVSAAGNPLLPLAVLPSAAEPQLCRLSAQQLIELLKMPTCFGEVRRVVLDHLGVHYHRHFADHWELARFAAREHLDLDLTSPPRPPAPWAIGGP